MSNATTLKTLNAPDAETLFEALGHVAVSEETDEVLALLERVEKLSGSVSVDVSVGLLDDIDCVCELAMEELDPELQSAQIDAWEKLLIAVINAKKVNMTRDADVPSNCWRAPDGTPSTPSAHPFRATLYWLDSTPGNSGWISRSQVFATLDEALAVAAMPMPRGCFRVDVDVAKNRRSWTTNGYWEEVGTRKPKQSFKWSKNWNEKRAAEVQQWLDSRTQQQ